ncbi:hypothetical protein N665_0406s0007 [Sinapis alba]|nr:hypothetical protein N665_0406s0007 [Sinapis alba]
MVHLSEHVLDMDMVEGKKIVKVPDEVLDMVPLWDDLLEGRFLASAPHVAKIHIIVNKICPLGDPSIKIVVFPVNEVTVKFRWSPVVEEEEEEEVKVIPMWITMKNVPHKMFSWKGLGFIASAVGKPKKLHPDTILCTSFEEAKVFVEADMTKELPKSHRFKSNIFSKWGHTHKACKSKIKVLTRQDDLETVAKNDAPVKVATENTVGSAKESRETEVAEQNVSLNVNNTQEARDETVVAENETRAADENTSLQTFLVDIEGSWRDVSMPKHGRQGSKSAVEHVTVVSPSQFSVKNVPTRRNNMSGFFWNVRGFNKSVKHSVVKKWVQDQGFMFGALQETRVKEGKSQRISNSVFTDWNLMSNYEFNPLGRIWLVWRPKVRVTPFYKTDQMITVPRRELWNDLKAHQDSPIIRQKAWIISGDFHEILDVEEHSMYGMRNTVSQGMRDFQAVTHHCNLLDLYAHGPQYTWTNKREEGLISKKLDRVLINDHWLGSYPQLYSVFDAGGCSDHLRCRFHLRSALNRPKRPFKFVNAVAELEGFKPLMENYWQATDPILLSTSSLYRFSKKLKSLKPKIRVLAKERMGNLYVKAKEAYENLCMHQEENIRNPTQENLDRENSAYARWEHVARLEEGFLK